MLLDTPDGAGDELVSAGEYVDADPSRWPALAALLTWLGGIPAGWRQIALRVAVDQARKGSP